MTTRAGDEGSPRGLALRRRLRRELRAYVIAALYLWVCFGALLLFKTGVLRGHGVDTLPFGLAAGKALILGKFLVIGEAARVGARARSRTLLELIVRKAVAFLVLLAALSALEELVVGKLRGRSFAETLAEYTSRSGLELFATCLLMLLILLAYFAFQELGRALGPGGLRRVLMQRPE
jgi:hypothetical protein